MKAVIYARYSSDNQREESIEGQLRDCMQYAEYNDIQIVGSYIDRALSAKTDNRPNFQKMIKDSAKRLFDVIIVWKLDRFARNRYDSAYYKNILKKNGVRVVSAKESISEGAEGIILESVLEGYAEYYSVELAEKVTRGMTDNALKAMSNGGITPLGYNLDDEQHLQIDESKAPFVREIFQRFADGEMIKTIIADMNARGVGMTVRMKKKPGKKPYTKPFGYNNVRRMLSNRKYIGEYRFKDIEGDREHNLIFCSEGCVEELLLLVQAQRFSVLRLMRNVDDGFHRVQRQRAAIDGILENAIQHGEDLVRRFSLSRSFELVDEVLTIFSRNGFQVQFRKAWLHVVFVSVQIAVVCPFGILALSHVLEIKHGELMKVRREPFKQVLSVVVLNFEKLLIQIRKKSDLTFLRSRGVADDINPVDPCALIISSIM